MNREQFIKFIPRPTNKDVILYDIQLKDLIDVDVLKEYNKIYPIFINKKEEYEKLEKLIKEYENTINNIYLYKPNWTEEDYLQSLQNDKKTYSTMYGEIKKIENNIDMLQKKIKGIDEKIEIQIAKEQKNIKDRKDNINKNIEQNKEKLLNLRGFLNYYKEYLTKTENEIIENQEDFKFLCMMQDDLKEGTYKCKYCGSNVKVNSEDSLVHRRLYKNLEKNKNELEKLLEQKQKIELNVSYYENEISKIKDELNNDIQFKKENFNFYHKKSIEVLKLEALRDEMINNVSNLEKSLKNHSDINSKEYLTLKSNMEKYELSLNNLQKIKDIKNKSEDIIKKFNTLKKELSEMKVVLDKYIKFITIYFKIYEQKANEYCGKDFKFKFFRIKDYEIVEIFSVSYQNIEYTQLPKELKEEVDKILIEKFSIYF